MSSGTHRGGGARNESRELRDDFLPVALGWKRSLESGVSIAPPRSFSLRSARRAARSSWIADPRFLRIVSSPAMCGSLSFASGVLSQGSELAKGSSLPEPKQSGGIRRLSLELRSLTGEVVSYEVEREDSSGARVAKAQGVVRFVLELL